MLFPNKTVSIEDSCIYKGIFIIENIKNIELMDVKYLYRMIKNEYDDVFEFIDCLTFLYALNKIDLIEGVKIKYVK